MPASPDVAVIGAGVVGLVTALTLARDGAQVTLIDEGAASNASSVAAAMLAPAAETALEGGDSAVFARLLQARDLWPPLAEASGVTLERCGAELTVDDAKALRGLEATCADAGIAHAVLAPPRLGVALPDDWRLDPISALQALREAALAAGVRLIVGRVHASPEGLLMHGERVAAGATVIAAGYGARAFADLAPELACLEPIKGQIAVFDGAPGSGPILRTPGVYLTPQARGARAGASMEKGKTDENVEPAVIADLAARAATLAPALSKASFHGAAGVRAATPDGWPLLGPSRTPAVLLAVGARRNGWLLAPMMAGLIADHLAGRASGELADAFHPGRFTR